MNQALAFLHRGSLNITPTVPSITFQLRKIREKRINILPLEDQGYIYSEEENKLDFQQKHHQHQLYLLPHQP